MIATTNFLLRISFLLSLSSRQCRKLDHDDRNTSRSAMFAASAFVIFPRNDYIGMTNTRRRVDRKVLSEHQQIQQLQQGNFKRSNYPFGYDDQHNFHLKRRRLSTFVLKMTKQQNEQQQHQASGGMIMEEDDHYVWIAPTTLSDDIINKNGTMAQNEIIEDFAGVVLYDNKIQSQTQPDKNGENQYKRWLRISSLSLLPRQQQQENISEPTQRQTSKANLITNQTLSWCLNFVSKLKLCPWANASLSTPNAIRMKIVPESLALIELEDILRYSALELLRVTSDATGGEEEGGRVDPNAAITFVVIAPAAATTTTLSPSFYREEFQFESFLQSVVDIEDRWFDEADEIALKKERREAKDYDEEEGGEGFDVPLGDLITMAPFHPHWHFAPSSLFDDDDNQEECGRYKEEGEFNNYDDGNDAHSSNNSSMIKSGCEEDEEHPIDYEKRTPYPTISLVRTSAIVAGGDEKATQRIGRHNDDILNDVGLHVLREIFRDSVMRLKKDREDEKDGEENRRG
mmetsp:Transcript_36280/g.54122  ORF Transcript_36280/g.54122 Transcript_36280/m.54122 type:complete len:515 (-) Transcript_36280:7009-8553(-)